MSVDPFQRFLGVDRSSDPVTLLGLKSPKCDAALVQAALRERLAAVYEHPAGRSTEAEQVRKHLRKAADIILKSIKQPPQGAAPSASAGRSAGAARAGVIVPTRHSGRSERPTAPVTRTMTVAKLTDFDRHVLAVLVGCGGWNATARSKLVALAGAYRVSVQGLMTVVGRLSEYAKSGGPRLGVVEITSGAPRVAGLPPTGGQGGGAETPWLTRVTPELRQDSLWAKIKLSLLFGFLTLLVGLVGVRALFFPAEPPSVPTMRDRPPITSGRGGPRRQAATVTPRPAPPPVHRLAEFPQPPTFRGQALSAETSRAADECMQLPLEIDALARRIAISDEPSDAVYRSWDVFMRTIGAGWGLIDESTSDAIERSIFEALYEASTSPSVADRLLAALTPPSGRLADPIDVWRGTWMVGMLGRISSSPTLSPVVTQRAQVQLDIALGSPSPDRTRDFAAVAGAWLDRTTASLADVTEFDERVYDFWECWIAAQVRLGRGERLHAAVMRAIEAILITPTDLSRPGPSVNVLGRLLSMVDFDASRVVKDRFREFFDDQERVAGHDLWVLTSLLAANDYAPWFSEDLVLPEDGDWMFRRRIADRITDRWPEAASAEAHLPADLKGIPVDPELAARWLAVLQSQLSRPLANGPEQLMDQLVTACGVNEAALWLAAGEKDRARELLDRLERADGSTREPAAPRVAPNSDATPTKPADRGQAIGPDGQWAASYEQAGRNTDERLSRLHALAADASGDLGPIDAEALVRVVYRGSPQEVRMLAQSIVVEKFTTGPTVALEMLDQFPGSSLSQSTAETIRRFTGQLLPSARSESWSIDARLALVEHVLALRRSGQDSIDLGMAAVADSYAHRRTALQPRGPGSGAAATPQEAAQGLADAWRDRVAVLSVADPVPGDLGDLGRRHGTRLRLAQGPLQRFLVAQLAVLDLMTFHAVVEQPALREPALALLEESAQQRHRMTHVLEQAVQTERTIARLWHLQMTVDRRAEVSQ